MEPLLVVARDDDLKVGPAQGAPVRLHGLQQAGDLDPAAVAEGQADFLGLVAQDERQETAVLGLGAGVHGGRPHSRHGRRGPGDGAGG